MDTLAGTLESDMLTAEGRWERIAQGLFVTGCLFLVFAAYGIYSGDDWRGIVMTLAPGAIVFGLWYMARARADYLMTGVSMPLPARVIAGTLVVTGVAFAIHTARMAPELEIVTEESRAARAQQRGHERMNEMMKNVEVVNGTLQRKKAD